MELTRKCAKKKEKKNSVIIVVLKVENNYRTLHVMFFGINILMLKMSFLIIPQFQLITVVYCFLFANMALKTLQIASTTFDIFSTHQK